MRKRIAVPLENGILCPHFGHCQTFAIISTEGNEIIDVIEVVPPEHVPGLYPKWIAGFGVTDVIVGGIGQKAILLFNQQHINAFVGAPIKPAKELAEDFLAGNLNLRANYCDHDSNHHQHA